MGARERKRMEEIAAAISPESITTETEDEITVMEVDQTALVAKLVELGAKPALDATIEDYYFDTEAQDIERAGSRVRIRKVSERSGRVWYRVDIKTDHLATKDGDTFAQNRFGERTLQFETFDEAYQELKKQVAALDAKKKGAWFGKVRIDDCKVRYRKKERISYTLNDVKFDFDTFKSQSVGWCSARSLPRLKRCKEENLDFMGTLLEAEIVYGTPQDHRRLVIERIDLLNKLGIPLAARRVDDFDRVEYMRERRKK